MSMGIQQQQLTEAAIHGLPNEILADIFDTIVKSVHESAQLVLVTLEQVCRRWRSVLLATPTLWTCVTIQHPRARPRHPLSRMRAYLTRSGACPLYVRLTDSDDVQAFLPFLLPHIGRIRHLAIDGRTVEGLHRIAAFFRDLAAPELLYLKFTLNFHTPPLAVQQALMPMTVFAGGTPNLTHVHIQLSGALDVFPLHIPENTASLKITPYPTTVASACLHSALDVVHNLTEILVHGQLIPVNTSAYGMDTIEAPRLRRLTQVVGRRRSTSFWPAVLRAPMLEHITLYARERRDLEGFFGDAPESFDDLAIPEQPMLRSLTIATKHYKGHRCDNPPWRGCEALRICSHLHNVLATVRHLTLVNVCRGGEVLADMLAWTPEGQRMPNLGIVEVSSPSMDWERLCGMLDLRRDAGYPLRVVGLTPAAVEEGADHLCSRVEVIREFSETEALRDPFADGQVMDGL
ncbi:hypothetical protein K523DRAFT_410665 [Schizophyllum commune Tattone D]|nr:hypothetical protein K523DRAFT_410665 [Schizophyllum commune Tattone D]